MADPAPPRARRRPTLQAYVLSLLILFVLVTGPSVAYVERENLGRASASAETRVGAQARLAAGDLDHAIELTEESVTGLAANPTLPVLFADDAASAGCSLTFTEAGALARGRIDIVDIEGAVRCSSDPLPAMPVYAGEPWIRPAAQRADVLGPLADPAGGGQVLVVTAPVTGLGLVATILELDPVADSLTEHFRGPLRVGFTLRDGDGTLVASSSPGGDRIAAATEVASLGWTVQASVDRDAALADARSLNRQLTLLLLAGLLVLIAATLLLYRGLARPIQRLSAAVRGASGPDGDTIALPVSGPAEVVALAADFSTLRADVAAELRGRREAEAEARASEESYRTLFAANPLPMWVYDTETLAFLDVNDAAVATYGYTRDELLAMTIRDIRPAEDEPAFLESLANSAPMQRSGPWHHLRKDGTVIDVEIVSHAVDFGVHRGRFVMAEDVTARERAQRLLQQAQRMESLGQLAGGIAHDFNNLLAVILNYADFAAEELGRAAAVEPERWDPVLHDVEQVGEAGRRAAALTQQLLSFARGQAAATDAVDLNAVATGLEDMLRRTLGERIALRLDLDPQLWPITANAAQLEQVIVNLAVNARDAMPSGGRLLVETANVEVGEHHQAQSPELAPGRHVRLRVSDTGIGIDAEAREHAFEPFFTTKERGSGTGLGLATVYGIVSQAGGTVQLYSEPGLGTSITALFPAGATPARASVLHPETHGRPHGDETVLLVEDDPELRAVTERILRRGGYEVVSAPDGQAALTVAHELRGQIDLVLTDVVMPEMLGSDLAAHLHDLDPEIPVLFMSGYAPPLLREGGRLPVGASLVDKPFSADVLLAKVREVLEVAT